MNKYRLTKTHPERVGPALAALLLSLLAAPAALAQSDRYDDGEADFYADGDRYDDGDYESDASDYMRGRLDNDRGARIDAERRPYRARAEYRGRAYDAYAVDVRVRSRMPSGQYGRYSDRVVFIDGRPVALESDLDDLDVYDDYDEYAESDDWE